MIQDWVADPYNPGLRSTAAYGHNQEGALFQGVLLSSRVLKSTPWNRAPSWLCPYAAVLRRPGLYGSATQSWIMRARSRSHRMAGPRIATRRAMVTGARTCRRLTARA